MPSIQRLLARVRQSTYRAREFLKTERGVWVRRWLGLIFVVLSVGFFAVTLIFSWNQLRPHLAEIDLGFVGGGLFATFITFLMGGLLWGAVEKGFRLGLGWRQSMFIHLVSNVTKYMPGYAWQYISKGYLCRADGNSARQISLAMFTEFALLISSGVMAASVVAGIFRTTWRAGEWQLPHWIWWPIAMLTAGITLWWILNLKRWLVKPDDENGQLSAQSQRPTQVVKTIDAPWLFAAWLVGIASWILFSVAVWFFVRSLYPITFGLFPQCAIALVGASIISILVIFTPNGIGVRETTMALLLVGVAPLSIGVVVSILARLAVVVGEALGLLFILPSLRLMAQRADSSESKLSFRR